MTANGLGTRGPALPLGRSLQLLGWLGLILTLQVALAAETRTERPASIQVIEQASLLSLNGERDVDLPHVLMETDVPPGGGRVRYRLRFDLPVQPVDSLGVFVPKLSLAGQLSLNGVLVGACGIGALDRLRCLHQPQLFVPPPSLWQAGTNTLEFEIHANARQMNGLSPVHIGGASELYRGPYLSQRLWQVDLLSWLTWLNLSLGLMALAVAVILGRNKVYLWFGLCSIDNALTNLNILIQSPAVSPELFSWFVFTMRLITIPLFLLMLLAIFERPAGWLQRVLLAFLLLMPLATWLSDNNRWVVLALHLPMVMTLLAVALFMVRWTWRSRQALQIAITLITHLLLVVVVLDMMRLAGKSAFMGVYWATYTATGFVLVLGITLMSRLAMSLLAERKLLIRQGLAMKAVDAAFWDWDLDTNRLILTEEMARLLGLPPGKSGASLDRVAAWRARIHPDDLPEVERLTTVAIRERSPLRLEYRVIQDDGTQRWLETRADFRRDEQGRSSQMVGISLDVTRRKQVETDLDHYRTHLEKLVAQRTVALQQAHEELLAAEREWARQVERQHLLKDMHDGLGSQLATARILMSQDRFSSAEGAALLGECLADLHLLVDTLGNTEQSLARALADYRYRCERRLSQEPARVTWRLRLADCPLLPERTLLQLLRILQEGLNNAIKHAQARQIQVEASYWAEGRIELSVTDDGVGLPAQIHYGRGLGHLESRARDIGAHLVFEWLDPGTRLRLTLPLGPPAAASAGRSADALEQ
ncbi:MAG: PAS domain S-box protein [Sphingobacteriia bacterium]|nr:PAS domain S-box protein [Sphingobacteriia bacterium]NCC41517.1 PAS domain S-box protein [Gammaproteobacteria bacterium]